MQLRSVLAGSLLSLIIVATIALSLAVTGDTSLRFDRQLTRDAQGFETAPTNLIVEVLNWFGHAEPFLMASAVIGLALGLRRRYADTALIVVAAILAQGINAVLKLYFASPRPPESLTAGSEQASGLGFPSGHTMSIVVLSICLGFVAWRNCGERWQRVGIVMVGLFAVFAMGFSRIHVGHHWPTDVLGAYLWGTLVAVTIIYAYSAMHEPSTPRPIFQMADDESILYRVRQVERYDPILGVCARQYELSPIEVRRRSRN